jgi:hypothetical protein
MTPVAEALAVLVEAFRVPDLSEATIRAYARGLEKIPPGLLRPMVDRAIATRKHFPRVSELREDADAARKQLIEAHPYESCGECWGGWRIEERTIDGPDYGVVSRCPCRAAYLAKMERLGVGGKPLQLTEAHENTREA